MHNKKLMFLFVATVVTMPALQAKRSWPGIDFDAIEEFFERQIEQFNRHAQAMRNSRRQPVQAVAIPALTAHATIPLQTLTANINETDKTVVITINGIDTQELDARVNDENTLLTIQTPQEQIEIEVEDNHIQVATHQQRSSQKNTSQDKGQFFGASASTISQPVTGDPKLGNQTIDYDPSTSTLTITIPKQIVAKKGTSVPVNITRSNQVSNEK